MSLDRNPQFTVSLQKYSTIIWPWIEKKESKLLLTNLYWFGPLLTTAINRSRLTTLSIFPHWQIKKKPGTLLESWQTCAWKSWRSWRRHWSRQQDLGKEKDQLRPAAPEEWNANAAMLSGSNSKPRITRSSRLEYFCKEDNERIPGHRRQSEPSRQGDWKDFQL